MKITYSNADFAMGNVLMVIVSFLGGVVKTFIRILNLGIAFYVEPTGFEVIRRNSIFVRVAVYA